MLLPNEEPSMESANTSTIGDTPSEAVAQPVVPPEAEEPVEEETPTQPAGPLGSWTRVKKVDSGPVFSPLTAKYRAEEERHRKEAEAREKQQEKLEPVVFTEKTSAVLTKKVKGPIEFKKRSAAKSVRQRTQ
ncbi:hypothetical protein COOONC_25430 [Cooperia oncophora]